MSVARGYSCFETCSNSIDTGISPFRQCELQRFDRLVQRVFGLIALLLQLGAAAFQGRKPGAKFIGFGIHDSAVGELFLGFAHRTIKKMYPCLGFGEIN